MTLLTRPTRPPEAPALDAARLRADFPILSRLVHGKALVYLDNAATTQKPRAVIDALVRYYETSNANVHRGVHLLSQEATDAFEAARLKVQHFLHAGHSHEIVFTRGATEAINLVAQCHARPRLQPGDEILITTLEHHSNIVPWQMACEATGAALKVAPINDAGELLLDEYAKLLSPLTKVVAVTHVSNALGTLNPVRRMIELARARAPQAAILIDGAQAVPHLPVNVQALDADFYVFSGHKVYGPTGIGVLYGKAALLDAMPPYQGGGDMIRSVTFEKTTYNDLPYKFEAGTPDIAGAIGLGAALDYLDAIGLGTISRYEQDLLAYGTAALGAVPGLKLIGTAPEKAGVISFVLDGIHPHDIGTILDQEGLAIRTGHHCAQPLMDRLGLPATARASLALYNTREELNALAAALRKVGEVFR